jgi:hypothetical protein
MKRSSGSRNTSSNFSDSVHHQLNMYALAAGAAGVGVLALSLPTEAKIIYTPAHVTIGVGQHYKLDLNHDGITDFTLMNTRNNGDSTVFYSLFEKPAEGNAVEARYDHNHLFILAKALWRGARIQAGRPFKHKSALMASVLYGPGGTASYGSWVNVSGRYLGLRFKINGQTHYGWARLSVSLKNQGRGMTATLTGYAYETIPNKSIIAGETKGPDDGNIDGSDAALTVPIPEPDMLGALAIGARGLSIWRCEKSMSAAPEGI